MTNAILILKKWLLKPKPNLISKFTAELSACMMFHFIGSISPTPWANGIALMVMVYYTAKTSGAHLNPALTLAFTLLGHTNPLEMFVYWAAQVTGCILGAFWIKLLVPFEMLGGHVGCFIPNTALSKSHVFGWEAFCTFTFLLPIFSVVWYTLHKAGYGNTGPLIVGLSLMANAFAAGPFTGAALNPARVLGSHIVFSCDNSYMVYYIVGEFLGATLVPLAIFPFYGVNDFAWYLDEDIVKKAPITDWIMGYQTNVRPSPRHTSIEMVTPKNVLNMQGSEEASTYGIGLSPHVTPHEEGKKYSRFSVDIGLV